MSEEKRLPKTKEELDELKKEFEELNKKLLELTEEELIRVTGGNGPYTGHKGCYVRRDPRYTGSLSFECDECLHWKRPDGPCELGLH